jgi:hypothetical protein
MPQPRVAAFLDGMDCSLRSAAGNAALAQTAECRAAAPAVAHPARSPVTRKNSSPDHCHGSLNFPVLRSGGIDTSLVSLARATGRCLTQLEDPWLQLEERESELTTARVANRELMTRVNSTARR